MEQPDMLVLMAEIDSLDKKLVELLSRRFYCSREIGAIKRQKVQAPYDPARVRNQQLNFVRQCVEADLDERMADKLIDIILQQVIAERLAQT
ncbi:MAG: chorismate mutase [Burkholderiaceae bacterium]|nr:chorismate mutase [Burkholderiaceae bacterium]